MDWLGFLPVILRSTPRASGGVCSSLRIALHPTITPLPLRREPPV